MREDSNGSNPVHRAQMSERRQSAAKPSMARCIGNIALSGPMPVPPSSNLQIAQPVGARIAAPAISHGPQLSDSSGLAASDVTDSVVRFVSHDPANVPAADNPRRSRRPSEAHCFGRHVAFLRNKQLCATANDPREGDHDPVGARRIRSSAQSGPSCRPRDGFRRPRAKRPGTRRERRHLDAAGHQDQHGEALPQRDRHQQTSGRQGRFPRVPAERRRPVVQLSGGSEQVRFSWDFFGDVSQLPEGSDVQLGLHGERLHITPPCGGRSPRTPGRPPSAARAAARLRPKNR